MPPAEPANDPGDLSVLQPASARAAKGKDLDIFMKNGNGSIYKGVVWPGVTAFPDWFHPKTQTFWDEQFNSFFNGTNKQLGLRSESTNPVEEGSI